MFFYSFIRFVSLYTLSSRSRHTCLHNNIRQLPIETARSLLNTWYRTTSNEQSLTDCMVVQSFIQSHLTELKENTTPSLEKYFIVLCVNASPQYLFVYKWNNESRTLFLLHIAAMFLDRTQHTNNVLHALDEIQQYHDPCTINRECLYRSQPFWESVMKAYDLFSI